MQASPFVPLPPGAQLDVAQRRPRPLGHNEGNTERTEEHHKPGLGDVQHFGVRTHTYEVREYTL